MSVLTTRPRTSARRRPLAALTAATLAFTGVAAGLVATMGSANAAVPMELRYSTSSNYSNNVVLQGATLSSKVAIYIPYASGSITQVNFSLDGTFVRTEKVLPFDFAGDTNSTSNLFDTATLSAGQHTISAAVTTSDGVSRTVSSTFTRPGGTTAPGIAAAKTRPYRIAFTGSSTTAGIGASTAEKRYVNVLATSLHAAYGSGTRPAVQTSTAATFTTPPTTPGVYAFNAGEGSTTSANYLWSTERANIAALKPDMITHMIGSNDYAAQMPIATYKSNLTTVLTDLHAKAPNAKMVLIHSYPRQDVGPKTITWSQYGQALRELAAANPSWVKFVDISGAYAAIGIPGSDPNSYLGPDKIHQTDAGYAFMARTLQPYLVSLS